MLDREHPAGARHARLDLVGDEQDVVTAADRCDALQEARRRHDEAALALDRLDDHGGHVLRREVRIERLLEEADVQLREIVPLEWCERPVRVWIGKVRDVRRRRPHKGHARVLRLARGGHRGVGPAVEGVLECDDPLPAGRDARDLHRVLDRLRAAVREHALRGKCRIAAWVNAIELLRQAHIRLIRDDLRRHVRVALELLAHRGGHVGMLVTEVERADPGDEIEVTLALRIPDLRPHRTRDDHRRADAQPARHESLA